MENTICNGRCSLHLNHPHSKFPSLSRIESIAMAYTIRWYCVESIVAYCGYRNLVLWWCALSWWYVYQFQFLPTFKMVVEKPTLIVQSYLDCFSPKQSYKIGDWEVLSNVSSYDG